jgi:hypothetical protein
MDQRISDILTALEKSENSRGKQYQSIDELKTAFIEMANRVKNVEDKLASTAPTIEEFITIKHKVVGAGQLGKWLWAAGAVLLGFIAGSREAIGHWLRGF